MTTNTQTNESGAFTVPGLAIGTYLVSITKPGFQKYTETGIILHPATVASVNTALKPGEATTTIEVSASAAQVQTATAEVANSVNGCADPRSRVSWRPPAPVGNQHRWNELFIRVKRATSDDPR